MHLHMKLLVNYVQCMVNELRRLVIFINHPLNLINHIFKLRQPFKILLKLLYQNIISHAKYSGTGSALHMKLTL